MTRVNIQPVKNGDKVTPQLLNDRFEKIADVINGNIDASNISDGSVGTVKLADGSVSSAKLSAAEDWQIPVWQNGWKDRTDAWGPVGYYKDHAGMVHFKGLATDGTHGVTMFTLPAGYRPAIRTMFASVYNDLSVRLDVHPDGTVYTIGASGVGWVSLSPIQFRAEG